MTEDERPPGGGSGGKGRESARQFADDLRETVGRRVSDNESSLRSGLGRAARWFDRKTGGKYAEQIGRAEGKVGEGIGWAAAQGGRPGAPGAGATTPGAAPAGAAPGAPGDFGHTAPPPGLDDHPTGPVRPAGAAPSGPAPATPPTVPPPAAAPPPAPPPAEPGGSPFARPDTPPEGPRAPRPPQDPPARPH